MPEYAIYPRFVSKGFVADLHFLLNTCSGEPDERGQFPTSARLHPYMERAAMTLAAKPQLQDFLDTKQMHCHWPPMARRVLPGDDKALWPLHVDTLYNPHIKGPFVSVWLPLVPIDEACGGITIERVGPLVPLEPGDAILMAHTCRHASMPNRSDRPRLSCDFRFFAASTPTGKHYLDCTTGLVVAPPKLETL